MAERLTRAKQKIARADIPYRVPSDTELPDRLRGVAAIVYLLFHEGWSPAAGEALLRPELLDEALRLARLLHGLMPDEPTAVGLLALLLLLDAPRAPGPTGCPCCWPIRTARCSTAGRSRRAWCCSVIACAARPTGPTPTWCRPRSPPATCPHRPPTTDWDVACSWYDVLLTVRDTPATRATAWCRTRSVRTTLPWRSRSRHRSAPPWTGAGTGAAETSARSLRQVVIDAFLGAAEHVEVVMSRTEVAERWHEPSALDGHTVGSLAAHLARSVFTVQRYLAAPPGSGETTTAAGYLVAVLGEADPVDSDLHRGVRKRARDEAAAGPVDLRARFAQARHDLAETLPACDLRRPVSVLDGIVVPLEEYLRTRIVEMVIHLDDLCVSVGTEPPDDLDAAFDIAAAVLVQVAIRRTGPWATLRSLARRERHPPAIRAL